MGDLLGRRRTDKAQGENQNAHTRGSPRYSYPQKIQAVTILAAHGGMTIEAKQEIRNLFNVSISTSTLQKWNNQYKDLVLSTNVELQPKEVDVAKLVADTRQQLLESLASTASKVAAHLNKDSVVDAMSGRDAAVVVGIATDKLLLMAGRKPELDNLLQRLIVACDSTPFNATHLLEDLVTVAERKKQELLELNKVQEIEASHD